MAITLTREEAQQVLDALEEVRYADISASQDKAIEILRARLAQPEREWQRMTDEEAEQIIDAHWNDPSMFIEAIEAKLKEKNA
jgi:hypothetical protein